MIDDDVTTQLQMRAITIQILLLATCSPHPYCQHLTRLIIGALFKCCHHEIWWI